MAPPEPLELALDTLADMPAGDRLVLRLGRQPYPLYDILRRMGYQWQVSGSDGVFDVLIWPADSGAGGI